MNEMTREELLQKAKPILFNTEMVRAILDGRKTVTRRAVRYKYDNTEMEMKTDKYGTRLIEIQKDIEGETYGTRKDGTTWHKIRGYIEKKLPYRRGDILYVRETWNINNMRDDQGPQIGVIYKADHAPYIESFRWCDVSEDDYDKYDRSICESNYDAWRPSIHMPKEAARIFLQVWNVRVERLQDITITGLQKEGIMPDGYLTQFAIMEEGQEYFDHFKGLWDATVPKKDLQLYGWEANPWVWVIEFERLEVD